MSSGDLISLLPLVVVAATALVVALAIGFRRNHAATATLTVAGLVIGIAVTPASRSMGPRNAGILLRLDGLSWFYMDLLMLAAIAVVLIAYSYMKRYRGRPEELYLLLLLATLGSMVLVCSNHFASLFLGLEMLSVSLYALAAYPYWRENALEAGVKYLILAAASSAMLLFGIALIYAAAGTLEFERLASYVRGNGVLNPALLLPGTVLLIAGLGFKLAVTPFHLWIPDVYQGAPAPISAFLATVSKGGVIGLLARLFRDLNIAQTPSFFAVFAVIAIGSMLTGNLLALLQSNVKRILAYSSIAHMGYLILAFLGSSDLSSQAATFYLVTYFVTILGSFAVVTVLSGPDDEAQDLDDYRSLFQRRPVLAVVFTAMLLSLAGIPVTAGFVGKFYVVAAAVSTARWILIAGLVLGSTIGLFYYLRIVIAMYSAAEQPRTAAPAMGAPAVFALAVLTAALVWIGIQPAGTIQLVSGAFR